MATRRDARGRLLPGSVNNPKGPPPRGLAISDQARRLIPPDEIIGVFRAILAGKPMTKYRLTGEILIRVTDGEPPEGSTLIDVVYPTVMERLRAGEYLWDKIEPTPRSVDLKVTNRPSSIAPDFTKMTPEQLDRYIAISQEMMDLADSAGTIDAVSEETTDPVLPPTETTKE